MVSSSLVGSVRRRAARAAFASLGRAYRWWALRRRVTDPSRVAAIALKQIRSSRYCLVVTESDRGPTARVVEPFPPAADGTIRFGTDPLSRKARDVRRSGRCLLVYQDDRRRGCVTVDCAATLEDWPESGSPRFKAMWTAFWPSGPIPQNYVVVACKPRFMEIWHGTAVVAPEPFGRRSFQLLRVGGSWIADEGDNGPQQQSSSCKRC